MGSINKLKKNLSLTDKRNQAPIKNFSAVSALPIPHLYQLLRILRDNIPSIDTMSYEQVYAFLNELAQSNQAEHFDSIATKIFNLPKNKIKKITPQQWAIFTQLLENSRLHQELALAYRHLPNDVTTRALTELKQRQLTLIELQDYLSQGAEPTLLLILAATLNQTELFQYLINRFSLNELQALLPSLFSFYAPAISDCLIEKINQLIENGERLSDFQYNEAFMESWQYALFQGNTKATLAITQWMKKLSIDFGSYVFTDGFTPLMHAIKCNNNEVIEALLQNDCENINYKKPFANTKTNLPSFCNTAYSLAKHVKNDDAIKQIVSHPDFDVHTLGAEELAFFLNKNRMDIALIMHGRGLSLGADHLNPLFLSSESLLKKVENYLMLIEKEWYLLDSQPILISLFSNQAVDYVNLFIKYGVPVQLIAEIAINLPTMVNYALNDELINHPQLKKPLEDALYQKILHLMETGNADEIAFFLEQHANIKIKIDDLLKIAATCFNPDVTIVDTLLAKGANPKSHGWLLPLLTLRAFANAVHIDKQYLFIAHRLLTAMGLQLDAHFDAFDNDQIDTQILTDRVFNAINDSLTPGQQQAFTLLHSHSLLAEDQNEYSGRASLVARANAKFEEMKTLFHTTFTTYGKSRLECIESIEYQIKSFILDRIVLNAQSHNATTMLEFIEKNRELLLDSRNQDVLEKFRALCTDKQDVAQTAWRAYDPYAPHDPVWPNLLTQNIDLRERVAYYFIARPSINEENFIGQLADIRHAHDHPTLDSPSCAPGTIGRIGRMGEGHPLLQLPPDRQEIIHEQLTALICSHFNEKIKDLSSAKQHKLYKALTYLTSSTALDIINQKISYKDATVALRIEFLKSFFEKYNIIAILNEVFSQQESEPPFNPASFDPIMLSCEFDDLGGKGRADAFYERISAYMPKSETLPPQEALIDHNPFKIQLPSCAPQMYQMLLKALEKSIQKHIEFELIFPVFRKHFHELPIETITMLAKQCAEEIVFIKNNPSNEISLSEVITKIGQDFNISDISTLETILKECSTITSINECMLTKIEECGNKLKSNTQNEDLKLKIDQTLTQYELTVRKHFRMT